MGAAVPSFPHLSSALLTQVPAGDPEGFDQTLWLRRPAKPLQRRARWIKPSFEEEAPAWEPLIF